VIFILKYIILQKKKKNKRVEIHSRNGTLFFPFLHQYIMDCELFAYRTHQTKREDKNHHRFIQEHRDNHSKKRKQEERRLGQSCVNCAGKPESLQSMEPGSIYSNF